MPWAFLFLCSCFNLENQAKSSKTKAEFSQFIAACASYVQEYGTPPNFQDTSEFAELITGDNSKRIRFYSFSEGSRDDEGQILDAFGVPIQIELMQ